MFLENVPKQNLQMLSYKISIVPTEFEGIH